MVIATYRRWRDVKLMVDNPLCAIISRVEAQLLRT
jgi:hypothetical protein